jgi:predicted nucleic acid-binding protein
VTVACVDSSWLLAVAFGDAEAAAALRRLAGYEALLASALLEAEVLAALRREGLPASAVSTAGISWVLPDRPLRPEVERVLGTGYLRGADLWHVATALFAAPDPAGTDFLTFDLRQREVAAALGFGTPGAA